MKPGQQQKTLSVVAAVLVLLGFWVLHLTGVYGFSVLHAVFAVPEASASGVYGISSQKAPELDLNTWIDGDGNQITPIRLENYRGRVVYLYFFQDW